MKIDPEKFQEYMLAKQVLNKMYVCATFGSDQPDASISLSRDECRALFSQKVIDLEKSRLMLE